MKDTLRNYFNTFFHTIADLFSVGEKIVIPWVLAQFKGKELLEVGAKLTYYYFAIILFFFWWKIPTLLFKPLNEIGDFLAGVFGPIAFGWLIIGYLMQNKELKNSVEQTGEAQRLARDQLEFQKKCKEHEELSIHNNSQPILGVKSLILEDEIDDLFLANFKAEIENHGSTIYDLCIYDCEIDKENEDFLCLRVLL